MTRICYNVNIQSGLAILDHFLTPNHHAEILRLYILACMVFRIWRDSHVPQASQRKKESDEVR